MNFRRSDIVEINGKKILDCPTRYYSDLSIDMFADMTEKEFSSLIHKAVPESNVHFNLSDLFTFPQLHILMNSDSFSNFSKHIKDDIYQLFYY